jgi:hypothetical protein
MTKKRTGKPIFEQIARVASTGKFCDVFYLFRDNIVRP